MIIVISTSYKDPLPKLRHDNSAIHRSLNVHLFRRFGYTREVLRIRAACASGSPSINILLLVHIELRSAYCIGGAEGFPNGPRQFLPSRKLFDMPVQLCV